MYIIEENIPIPLFRAHKRKSGETWPLPELKPGQSFVVPDLEVAFSKHPKSYVSASVSVFAKRTKRKFTVRRIDNGYRIWRLE
jgi:hypothetical protein